MGSPGHLLTTHPQSSSQNLWMRLHQYKCSCRERCTNHSHPYPLSSRKRFLKGGVECDDFIYCTHVYGVIWYGDPTIVLKVSFTAAGLMWKERYTDKIYTYMLTGYGNLKGLNSMHQKMFAKCSYCSVHLPLRYLDFYLQSIHEFCGVMIAFSP